MKNYNEPNWDKIRDEKDERINWYNSKNNACTIVAAGLEANGTVRERIADLANWLYELEPANKAKAEKAVEDHRYDNAMANKPSKKQTDFITKLEKERGLLPTDLSEMNSLQASKKIEELLKIKPKQKSEFTKSVENEFADDFYEEN